MIFMNYILIEYFHQEMHLKASSWLQNFKTQGEESFFNLCSSLMQEQRKVNGKICWCQKYKILTHPASKYHILLAFSTFSLLQPFSFPQLQSRGSIDSTQSRMGQSRGILKPVVQVKLGQVFSCKHISQISIYMFLILFL